MTEHDPLRYPAPRGAPPYWLTPSNPIIEARHRARLAQQEAAWRAYQKLRHGTQGNAES